jgi:integrase
VLKENDKVAGLYSELSKYLRIAGNTGLRVSEVLSIKLNQLYDLENNQPIKTLKISKKNLKGGKKENSTVVARYIPLSDELTSYVTNYIKHKSDNDPTTLDYKSKFISVCDERIRQLLDQAIRKYLPNVTGEPISTHSIRKMFAIAAYSIDKNLPVVKELLGHKSLGSTSHYLKSTLLEIDKNTSTTQKAIFN